MSHRYVKLAEFALYTSSMERVNLFGERGDTTRATSLWWPDGSTTEPCSTCSISNANGYGDAFNAVDGVPVCETKA